MLEYTYRRKDQYLLQFLDMQTLKDLYLQSALGQNPLCLAEILIRYLVLYSNVKYIRIIIKESEKDKMKRIHTLYKYFI